MAEEIKDAILPVLIKIQEDAAAFRAEMRTQLAEIKADVNARFDAVDVQLRKQRRNIAGILVIGKSTAANFDERIAGLERRVTLLERHPS